MLATAALIIWLITIFALSCFAAAISIQNKIQLKAMAKDIESKTFVSVASDPEMEAEEKRLNAQLAGYEDDELGALGQVSESAFRQGAIL